MLEGGQLLRQFDMVWKPLSSLRTRTVFLIVIAIIVLFAHAVIVVPGLLAGKRLVGLPNSGAIYSSGGFHCSGDGPNRIHYHTCQGDAVPLPDGTRASDYPYMTKP